MVKLSRWQRGFAVRSCEREGMAVYFWFYEWNMFDAVREGQHTSGHYDFPWTVDDDCAHTASGGLQVEAVATEDGALLTLTVTNESGHDWPDVAGIIPCFNPGDGKTVEQNRNLVDDGHTKTYFLGPDGFELLQQREIHFNSRLRPSVDRLCRDGAFAFSHKWPNSDRNAAGGLIVRESVDGGWVAGIAWEDFLSAQGHNPWNCMHLCVRVGPLKRSESRTVRGRIYLFEGAKEACLERCRSDLSL